MNSKFWIIVFAVISACSVTVAFGSEPVLTARPGICILADPAKRRCEMAVDLLWNGADRGAYCLYSSTQTEALECWDNLKKGRYHFELASSKTVIFWMQRPPDAQQLSTIRVRIVSPTQRNPERRRRRHIYSVL